MSEKQESTMPVGQPVGETDFLPVLVLRRRGAVPVKISTGNTFPRK